LFKLLPLWEEEVRYPSLLGENMILVCQQSMP
jgi:hypothetical protein